MDAGSGAQKPISTSMIQQVSACIEVPLIVGGGNTTTKKAKQNCDAGADISVVGNAIEKDINLIKEMSAAIRN